MQAYGSLALEDDSEVGEAVLAKGSIFPASTPVPSSSQPSFQWVLPGEDLVISSTCGVGVTGFNSRKYQLQRDLNWSWDTSSWPLRQNLVTQSKVGCMTANGVLGARFARTVGKIPTELVNLWLTNGSEKAALKRQTLSENGLVVNQW